MKHKVKLKVTITKIFEAEFDDALAASRMFKTLERDPQIGALTGTSGEGWSVRQVNERHGVESLAGRELES
ncbi:MAG TPA: hypothetical protein VLE97_06555 [Gaiellaceae bacterium]|nr:hypothetical protein [Gaiellaceae bacterium]